MIEDILCNRKIQQVKKKSINHSPKPL